MTSENDPAVRGYQYRIDLERRLAENHEVIARNFLESATQHWENVALWEAELNRYLGKEAVSNVIPFPQPEEPGVA